MLVFCICFISTLAVSSMTKADANPLPEGYSIRKPNYECDFENGTCYFLKYDPEQHDRWKIGRGKSESKDTGPSSDHTFGNATGNYLYATVSGHMLSQAKFQTWSLDSEYCVRFFYHMNRGDYPRAYVGEFDVQTENAEIRSDFDPYFHRIHSHGDRWHEVIFTAKPAASMRHTGYKVVFIAGYSSWFNFEGEIAIDDLSLTPGRCPVTNDPASLCTFDENDCGYVPTRTSTLNWAWKSETSKDRDFYDLNFIKLPNGDHTLGTAKGGYWFSYAWFPEENLDDIGPRFHSVLVSSPEYMKPNNSLNCLQFYYYIDGLYSEHPSWGRIRNAYIQVHLNYPESYNNRTWITTVGNNVTSLNAEWTYAQVAILITQPYQIQFTAGVNSPVEVILALDDVKTFPGEC